MWKLEAALKSNNATKIEDAAHARVVVEELQDALKDAIKESGAGVGFVFGAVGPPIHTKDGDVHQDFFFNSNAIDTASLVGLLAKCMNEIARIESRSRIIDPNEGGVPQ
jgi:hypothetical protein